MATDNSLVPAQQPGAVTGTAGTTASSVTVDGSIVLTIGGQAYTLSGTVGSALIVAYHQPFDQAVNLGPITSIINEVGAALGAPGIAQAVTDQINNLVNANIPILSGVVKLLTSANIRITDLAINTQTSVYQFGFALDFTTQNPPVTAAGITLQSFGLRVTYTKPASS